MFVIKCSRTDVLEAGLNEKKALGPDLMAKRLRKSGNCKYRLLNAPERSAENQNQTFSGSVSENIKDVPGRIGC